MTTRSDLPPTLGLLLAGGASVRMSGADKALCEIAGRSLLSRVVDQLRPQCAVLLLNSNSDPAQCLPHGLPVVADSLPGRPGPLAGLLAGLDWASANHGDIEWVLSASVDCPFLPVDLATRLHRARKTAGAPAAIAKSGGRQHPVIALWHVSLRADLRDALEQGVRKVGEFVRRHACAEAEWPIAPFDPFFNVNTPADLAEARRLAALADGA